MEKLSDGIEAVAIEDLSLEFLKKRNGNVFFIKPNKCFKQGMIIDGYTQSAILKVVERLDEEKSKRLDSIIFKDPYRFAHFIDKMWGWFK